MHARSALFDLYGDHLRSRGGQAPVAALVRMLSPLDVSAAAVRTAISRMSRQGWLRPVQLEAGRGYALTLPARRRLDEAARRIYQHGPGDWDGCWDLLVLEPIPDRSRRRRLRSQLGFLGYAPLSDSTWISPFRSPEVADLLDAEKARAAQFRATDADPRLRAQQAWDLDALGAAYRRWQREAEGLVTDPSRVLAGPSFGSCDERAFAVRSYLLHEWRKFLFADPGLPRRLLPVNWPGTEAAEFFADAAGRLQPAASRFVDACLADP